MTRRRSWSGSRGRCRSRCSPSTRRTASRSGATTSGPTTSTSAGCASCFPGVPLVACTATADPQTREDMRRAPGPARRARSSWPASTGPTSATRSSTSAARRSSCSRFLERRAGRGRHRLLPVSRKRVEEVAERLRGGRRAGRRLPRRPARRGAHARAGGLPARRRARRGGHRRLRHGHRQVQRALRRALRPAQEHRGLLPGDRAGRPRRPARRGAAALRPRRRRRSPARCIESGDNPEQVRIELHKLNAMVGFAEAQTCRRRVLLGYFGEHARRRLRQLRRLPRPARALRRHRGRPEGALLRLPRAASASASATSIDVLRGAETERILQLRPRPAVHLRHRRRPSARDGGTASSAS